MALKDPAIYTALFAAKLGVPPTSPHILMYKSVIEIVALMLADADVSPLPSMAAPSGTAGGPILGLGKLV